MLLFAVVYFPYFIRVVAVVFKNGCNIKNVFITVCVSLVATLRIILYCSF